MRTTGGDGQDARTNRSDNRRMTGQHAEIAFHAGDVNLIDFAGEGEFFGRNQIEVEGGHGEPASSEWRMASSERKEWLLTIRHSLFAIRRLGCFSRELLALLDGFF